MLTKEELLELLGTTETVRLEKTVSTDDRDKFCAAICAFANDMPGEGRNGYLKVLGYVNRFGRVQSELASNGNAPAAFHPDIGIFKVIVLSTLCGTESILTAGQSIPFAAESRPLAEESILKGQESILTMDESILTQRIREWAQQALPTGIRADGRANMVKVLEIVGLRPEATQQEIATKICVSLSGVKKLTSSLKDMGVLIRKGPDFGGRWELVGFNE